MAAPAPAPNVDPCAAAGTVDPAVAAARHPALRVPGERVVATDRAPGRVILVAALVPGSVAEAAAAFRPAAGAPLHLIEGEQDATDAELALAGRPGTAFVKIAASPCPGASRADISFRPAAPDR